jgi:signal transduction histidine kinase
MITSLLDISRLESGQMSLERSRYDLAALARRSLADLSVVMRDRDVRVELPEGPAVAECDHAIMHRVITNLLGNAAQHTPEGASLTLRIGTLPERVRVEVEDTGPGIPEEQQERIFDMFGQVEGASRSARNGSSGIGLTFCKLAVEAHGGRIGVDSAPGSGSTFWFELPSAGAPVPDREPAVSASF